MISLGYPTEYSRLRIVRIADARGDNPTVRTLTFNDALCSEATPGQFIMVWIPGVDEVPMSLSVIGPGTLAGITVRRVGEATAALHMKKEGDIIGIRGPFGNGFRPVAGRVMLVAGGTGVAPLIPLAERLAQMGADVTFILGAKTEGDLPSISRLHSVLKRAGSEAIVTTEDGSVGVKGLPTDLVEAMLGNERFDVLYTCGPEMLMRKVFDAAERHGVPLQASLERYIKCGIGLCGQCVLDPLGLRICVEGPVFDTEVLRRTVDFGRYSRDASGKRVELSDELSAGRTLK